MHRCLLKSLGIWQPESEGGYLSQQFNEALDNVSSCPHRLVKETLTKSRLLELSRCIFSDFERIDRDDRPNALQAEASVMGEKL